MIPSIENRVFNKKKKNEIIVNFKNRVLPQKIFKKTTTLHPEIMWAVRLFVFSDANCSRNGWSFCIELECERKSPILYYLKFIFAKNKKINCWVWSSNHQKITRTYFFPGELEWVIYWIIQKKNHDFKINKWKKKNCRSQKLIIHMTKK